MERVDLIDLALDAYHGGENWRAMNNPVIEREQMRKALEAVAGRPGATPASWPIPSEPRGPQGLPVL
jgi:hypothetical protein